MFTRVLRSPDSVDGGGAESTGRISGATGAAPELPIGGEDGRRPDLRVRRQAFIGYGPLSDADVRSILGDCCSFLRQLVAITGNVVESIGLGQVRKIVAAEISIPRGTILEDGTMAMQDVAGEPDRDHRKNPRGRKHPLITLVQMALQGVRLLLQITSGTNPVAHDKETLTEQREREATKEAERREREALREEEKTLSKILAGKY
jgi:hypothetical protein